MLGFVGILCAAIPLITATVYFVECVTTTVMSANLD